MFEKSRIDLSDPSIRNHFKFEKILLITLLVWSPPMMGMTVTAKRLTKFIIILLFTSTITIFDPSIIIKVKLIYLFPFTHYKTILLVNYFNNMSRYHYFFSFLPLSIVVGQMY